MRPLLPAIALCALATLVAAPAAAQSQSCSTLAVSGSGQPGSSLAFKVSGAPPRGFTVLLLGPRSGQTVLKFGPLGTLTLGLARPFRVLPLGRTDANGEVSRSLRLPQRLPSIRLYAQAVTIGLDLRSLPPKFKFCTSNVVSFRLGGR